MSKKILIIDDETDLVDLTKVYLESENYNVVTAHDGEEGLQKAESENPDLILLDINMPKLNGYQVLEKLKGNSGTKEIIVVMFSTNCTQRDIDKARKLGADDYITKPFEAEQLIDNLKKFFKK